MHNQNILQNWEKSSALVKELVQLGAEKFFRDISNIKQAFQPDDQWLRCIDEGTPGGVHMAGSGILLGVEAAAEAARAAGATRNAGRRISTPRKKDWTRKNPTLSAKSLRETLPKNSA